MNEYMEAASAHVIEHARYSSAKVKPEKPYFVRYPLSCGSCLRSDDPYDLVKQVAKRMKKLASLS